MLTDYDIRKAYEIAETILSFYGYPMVNIVIKEHTQETYITCKRNTIYIGRLDYWKIDNLMIHELSHLITYYRYGTIKQSIGNENGFYGIRYRYISHGKEFKAVLREVVMLWYNNIDAYCWDYEYSSIKKEYHKSKNNL